MELFRFYMNGHENILIARMPAVLNLAKKTNIILVPTGLSYNDVGKTFIERFHPRNIWRLPDIKKYLAWKESINY